MVWGCPGQARAYGIRAYARLEGKDSEQAGSQTQDGGQPAADEIDIDKEKPIKARSAPIHVADYRNFGYTKGCGGCKALAARAPHQPHSQACRKRMEEEIGKTLEGKARLERAEGKKRQYLSDAIEWTNAKGSQKQTEERSPRGKDAAAKGRDLKKRVKKRRLHQR